MLFSKKFESYFSYATPSNSAGQLQIVQKWVATVMILQGHAGLLFLSTT